MRDITKVVNLVQNEIELFCKECHYLGLNNMLHLLLNSLCELHNGVVQCEAVNNYWCSLCEVLCTVLIYIHLYHCLFSGLIFNIIIIRLYILIF